MTFLDYDPMEEEVCYVCRKTVHDPLCPFVDISIEDTNREQGKIFNRASQEESGENDGQN